jgi:hypothetical protein
MQFFLAYILRPFFVAVPPFAPAPPPVVTAGHVHKMILMKPYLRSGSVSRPVAVGPQLSPTMGLLYRSGGECFPTYIQFVSPFPTKSMSQDL